MNNRDNGNDILLKGIKIATHKKSSVTSVFDVLMIISFRNTLQTACDM